MAQISNKVTSQLDTIKDTINNAYQYFNDNYKRYHQFKKFVYETSIDSTERAILHELGKPPVQFNILEAYISRLCGEFSSMDPAFSVRGSGNVTLVDPQMIDLVEAHMKAAFTGSDKDALSYHLYKDILVGGFSVAKVYTDYENAMSLDQNIFIERVFDPTLCGFDPLARQSHKGDGRYAFECFPKSKDEAVELYGEDILKDIKFTRDPNVSHFNWSYRNQDEDIVMFVEYYQKKKKKTKIFKLSNGRVLTEKDYEMFVQQWEEQGIIEQPPQVVNSRQTTLEIIEKFTLCESKIVDHTVTDYTYFPLVFFDGNSAILRDKEWGEARQMTRPYIYQAKDTQKMKNFAGQALCNELENLVQHKWIAPIEGCPTSREYQEAYINPQKATTVLYNSFRDNDPNVPLNPPREVVRPPIPAEISNTFAISDQTIQAILGSYDAALGINDNELSGNAIMQGAMQSNAASQPYLIGFINGWNRLGQIYLDLLPKYFVTPRTIPIITPDGKHDYYTINAPGNVQLNYDTNSLQVDVEAGVNFAVQKQLALKVMNQMMQSSVAFNQLMNTKGLSIMVDNLDIRGAEQLKLMADEFMQEQQQQAAQQQQQNPQALALQVQQQKLNLQAQQMQNDHLINTAQLLQQQQEAQQNAQLEAEKIATNNAIKNRQNDIQFMQVMQQMNLNQTKAQIEAAQVDAENSRTAVDVAMKVERHANDMASANVDLAKKMNDLSNPTQPPKENENGETNNLS